MKEELSTTIDNIEKEANKYKMGINENKTKYLGIKRIDEENRATRDTNS